MEAQSDPMRQFSVADAGYGEQALNQRQVVQFSPRTGKYLHSSRSDRI